MTDKGGRPIADDWGKTNFQVGKSESGKRVAKCLGCGIVYQNTDVKRREAHQ
jgi:hypothetical protein